MTQRLLADSERAACEAKGKIRVSFLGAHNLWCNTVQYYQTKIQQHDRNLRGRLRPCNELQQVVFWLYVALLFGGSIYYFLWSILAYTNAAGWSFRSSKAGARTGASGGAASTDSSVLSAGDTDGATNAGNLSLMCDARAKTQVLAALRAPRLLPQFSILTNAQMSEAV